MNKLPKIGDKVYAESGNLSARNLEVIEVEEKTPISSSMITVSGEMGKNLQRTIVDICRI